MQNVRNIDVVVSIMDCADAMLQDTNDDEMMFEGFYKLRKLCSMLTQDFFSKFSNILDIREAIYSVEEEFLAECDDEELIVGLSEIYAYGSTVSRFYKMLAAPAFTEGFIPVIV